MSNKMQLHIKYSMTLVDANFISTKSGHAIFRLELKSVWFWFIFDLDNELITIIVFKNRDKHYYY